MEPRSAQKYLREAIALFERIGSVVDLAITDRNLGDVLQAQGNLTEAVDAYRTGLLAIDKGAAGSDGSSDLAAAPRQERSGPRGGFARELIGPCPEVGRNVLSWQHQRSAVALVGGDGGRGGTGPGDGRR